MSGIKFICLILYGYRGLDRNWFYIAINAGNLPVFQTGGIGKGRDETRWRPSGPFFEHPQPEQGEIVPDRVFSIPFTKLFIQFLHCPGVVLPAGQDPQPSGYISGMHIQGA